MIFRRVLGAWVFLTATSLSYQSYQCFPLQDRFWIITDCLWLGVVTTTLKTGTLITPVTPQMSNVLVSTNTRHIITSVGPLATPIRFFCFLSAEIHRCAPFRAPVQKAGSRQLPQHHIITFFGNLIFVDEDAALQHLHLTWPYISSEHFAIQTMQTKLCKFDPKLQNP